MYQPTTRLLATLELLQARGQLSGAELAERLEVDRRSVRRYVAMLQDVGIPIEGTRGPAGGYRLRPGFKLPPLMLTDGEALAITLALLVAPRSGIAFDPVTTTGALAKLERVLPDRLSERVRTVQEAIAIGPAPGGPETAGDLVVLAGESVRHGRQVHLKYRAGDGSETERDVDPYGIASVNRRWYLVGHCHLRGGQRTFRLDRVLDVSVTGVRFTPPPEFDAVGAVVGSLSDQPGRWQIELLVALPLEDVERRFPRGLGECSSTNEGTCLRFRHDDLDAIARYLGAMGLPMTRIEPRELRIALRALAAEIATIVDAVEIAG